MSVIADLPDRRPPQLAYAGTLFLGDRVNAATDLQLRAQKAYAEHRAADYYLHVWHARSRYFAEVYSCQRYQETLAATDIYALLAHADERWAEGGA